ncbi:MAG: Ribosomal RNA small subunit methyltransferase A [Anaerolinea thermophila]|uniref:Ribosomal RNA small subunit methyltransferase A n=1 Tax=Anaerolinea thermophila TaxID=167964 RepID=A0A101FX35_9CHLR|nr:MAG: Ribosomal RNA small subunit methyltransferase A [Anaerolinea thermophila]
MTLNPLHIPELLRHYGIRPQKSLGQNFLADHNALLKIVQDAGVSPDDRVLEIGAGVGNLTRILAAQAKQVIAVEIDQNLFPVLEVVTHAFENVTLIKGDILELPLESLFGDDGYLVVANIPYYITSAVIRHLLEAEVRPARIVLTMQREVAERIINKDEKMSLLSLSVQVYGEARMGSHIPASCFYPEPNVDSSVLLIDVYREPKLSPAGIQELFKLAHAAFNQKRKMLRGSLSPLLGYDKEAAAALLEQAGIDPRSRPETLALEDWISLVEVLGELGSTSGSS